jgi:hypothetical protein
MDPQQFDILAETLTEVSSRRRTLGGLLAAALALMGGPAVASKSVKQCKTIDDKQRRKRCLKQAKTSQAGRTTCLSGLRSTDDLQAAVDTASPGDTLVLCPGTWALKTTVTITKNLTLQGAGVDHSILRRDAGKNEDREFRVLHVAGGATVTVQDLTITNGSPPGYEDGGGILNDGTLTLVNLNVTDNGALAGGGLANHGVMTLVDSRVTGNGLTGAFFAGGIFNMGTLTLEAGSRVSGNGAWLNGGGIYNQLGTVTLQAGSSVTENGAETGGGIGNHGGTVRLEAGSSVTGNRAVDGGAGGGGIVNVEGTVSIADGSIVTGNTPNNCAGEAIPATCIG